VKLIYFSLREVSLFSSVLLASILPARNGLYKKAVSVKKVKNVDGATDFRSFETPYLSNKYYYNIALLNLRGNICVANQSFSNGGLQSLLFCFFYSVFQV
jgi:hypothetical protein